MNSPTPEPRVVLADANQVTDNLWIGAEISQTDPALARRHLAELMNVGIESIIDCRMIQNDIDWVTDENPTIDYLSIGVEDAGFAMPDDWFDDGTEYALDQISDGRVVFAHSQKGINRAPTMAFAILVAQGCDVIDALDLIYRARPSARIGYAEDAADWWLRKVAASDATIAAQIRRITKWRMVNGVPRTVTID